MSDWTFLTNHAHVLFCIAGDPDARLRDIAQTVQITERAAQRIVGELALSGCVTITRVGRRNTYAINRSIHLRHSIEAEHTVGELIDLILGESG
ncbi:MAG: hypothetical protein ACI9U2_003242 [Bradymonadia bacterium]|jgi:hypothetical protein